MNVNCVPSYIYVERMTEAALFLRTFPVLIRYFMLTRADLLIALTDQNWEDSLWEICEQSLNHFYKVEGFLCREAFFK